VRARFAIGLDPNCLLVVESLCCGFGIIRFDRNSTAFYKQFALPCKSGAKINPHLNPLPLAKGRGDHYTHTLYRSEVITLRHMFAVRSPIAKNVAKNFTRNLMLGYEDNLRGTGIRK